MTGEKYGNGVFSESFTVVVSIHKITLRMISTSKKIVPWGKKILKQAKWKQRWWRMAKIGKDKYNANLKTYICKHETSPTLTCVKMFFNWVCNWSASVAASSLKQTVKTFRWIIEQCSINLRHVAALNFPPSRQIGFWIWQSNKKANIMASTGC